MYGDLKAVNDDASIFFKLVMRFGFPRRDVCIYKQPSMRQDIKTFTMLRKECRMTPNELVFIICLFASHGMIRDGRQVIVINEFDKSAGFYKLCGVEENIRSAARASINAYYVSIFACCREILLR